jgi:hypothetical protein
MRVNRKKYSLLSILNQISEKHKNDVMINESITMQNVPGWDPSGTDSTIYFYENDDDFNNLVSTFNAGGTSFGNACEDIIMNIIANLSQLNNSDIYPFAFDNFPFADAGGPIVNPGDRRNLKEQYDGDYNPFAAYEEFQDDDEETQSSAGAGLANPFKGSDLVLYSIKTVAVPDRQVEEGYVNVTAKSSFNNYCQAVDAIYRYYTEDFPSEMSSAPIGVAPGWIGIGLSGAGTLAIGCQGLVLRCDIVTPGSANFLSGYNWLLNYNQTDTSELPTRMQSDGSIALQIAPNANRSENKNAEAFNDSMLGGQGNIQSFYFAVCKNGGEEAAQRFVVDGKPVNVENFKVFNRILLTSLDASRNAAILKSYAEEIAGLDPDSTDIDQARAAIAAAGTLANVKRNQFLILTQVARKIGNQVADQMQDDYQLENPTKVLAALLIQNVAKETKSLIEEIQTYTEEDIQQFAPDFEGSGRLVTPGGMALTEVGDRLMQSANSILQLAQLLNAGEIYADSNGVIQGNVPSDGRLPRGYTRRRSGIIVPTSFQNESTQKSKPAKVIDRTEKEEFERLFDNPIFETLGYKQMGSSLKLLQDVIEKINPNFDFEYLKNIVESGMKYLKTLNERSGMLKRKYSLLNLLEEQMVPMPALGAGSAQYDSRRVEDPFDIDPRTMSLLGLLGAEEVDIDETDVDTDLDGIPNRFDDEDDTPQGFGAMMERFLRNTHQKEDNYKKEKQERQFGLSHAALLKKKYYGRY